MAQNALANNEQRGHLPVVPIETTYLAEYAFGLLRNDTIVLKIILLGFAIAYASSPLYGNLLTTSALNTIAKNVEPKVRLVYYICLNALQNQCPGYPSQDFSLRAWRSIDWS
jgi:hypothetical protein